MWVWCFGRRLLFWLWSLYNNLTPWWAWRGLFNHCLPIYVVCVFYLYLLFAFDFSNLIVEVYFSSSSTSLQAGHHTSAHLHPPSIAVYLSSLRRLFNFLFLLISMENNFISLELINDMHALCSTWQIDRLIERWMEKKETHLNSLLRRLSVYDVNRADKKI